MSSEQPVVYVVDDDLSFRNAVTRLLRAGGYSVETFSSAEQFLKNPADVLAGCILADLHMPEMNGLDFQDALNRRDNSLAVVFLTGHGDIPTSVQAMRQGAEDFLTKPVVREKLFVAVERAFARTARERGIRHKQREMRELFATLTPREKEVLAQVVTGKLNKQIASDLDTSERTVKAHRANFMAKLKIQSVAELVRLAQSLGI